MADAATPTPDHNRIGTPVVDPAQESWIHQTLNELTVEEKIALTTGANFWNTTAIERLGIPGVMLTDGPHGVRKQGGAADHLGINASLPATAFPTAATLANSWDEGLLQRVGEALGEEARAYNVAVLLGPGLNLKRDPLGGRNFEYFSEDPYLSGTLAGAMIRGIESTGVAACPKHFAVNSQETHRMTIDELVDERALHELYLEGFRIAIRQGKPRVVMSAYNKINGTFAHENSFLLKEVLRRQWGFAGMVVSDWGGTHDRVASVRHGGSLEMPSTSGFSSSEVRHALTQGDLTIEDLDARVREVLRVVLLALPPVETDPATVYRAHRDLARQAAAKSIVLLKNDADILPLSPQSGTIGIVGDFAAHPRYQGSGSSRVNPHALVSLNEALAHTNLTIKGYAPGFTRSGRHSQRKLNEAVSLARGSDVVVAFIGLDESAEAEGFDREHMRLPANQLRTLRALVDTGCPVVVVLAGGAPVELPFADHVAAIVHAYLPGQEGGAAIADVLTGVVNPAGRLAETYPLSHSHSPASPWFARGQVRAEHRESLYVGYRYHDKISQPVRYPFGHGLSYTTFEYSDLTAAGDHALVTVTNTGQRAGDEVIQIYTEPIGPEGFRPVRELAGFTRLTLGAGQSTQVEIPLRENAFGVYDVDSHAWRIRPGSYWLRAGASSRDHRLGLRVNVTSSATGFLVSPITNTSGPGVETSGLAHVDDSTARVYHTGRVQEVSEDQFASLLDSPLPPPLWDLSAPVTVFDPIAQGAYRRGLLGWLYRFVQAGAWVLRRLGRDADANNAILLLDFPIYAMSRMSAGRVTPAMLDSIVDIANGRIRRGFSTLIRTTLTRRRQ